MAPRKRKTNTKSINIIKNDINDVTYESALCPVCRSVLIEPVTLPCGHNFCLICFNETVNNAALVCPLCRTRISSWLRQARKESNLVNSELWKVIQNKFATFVESKLKGQDDGLEEQLPQPPKILAPPGEIKKEYEKQISVEQEQLQREREEEERKSKDLILRLTKEEELAAKLEEEKLRRDEELAKKLAEEEAAKQQIHLTPKNHKKIGPLDSFVLLSNKIDKTSPNVRTKNGYSLFDSLQNQNNLKKDIFPAGLSFHDKKNYLLNESVEYMQKILMTESDDTINQEITHIKPINLVPRTPPKSDKNGRIIESPIIRSTPIRLSQENIEYNKVKSSKLNIIAQDSEHISAFKSTSPYKNDITDEHLLQNRAVKCINFVNSTPSTSPTSCIDKAMDVAQLDEEDIISQQKELEKMILQEQQDFEYARKLHEELNYSETKTYELRTVRPKCSNTNNPRKRQSTMDEICTRKKFKVQ